MGIFITIIIVLAIYAYWSVAVMTMADKTGVPNGWYAFIPIVNIWLMLNIARKPVWWLILFFVPFVNAIMAIVLWMALAQAMGHPSWWGIMLIVPFVNMIVPGYLAWAKPTLPSPYLKAPPPSAPR